MINRVRFLPWCVAAVALLTLLFWWWVQPALPVQLRVPGMDGRPEPTPGAGPVANPVLRGRVVRGEGQPADWPGQWTQFRGENRLAIDAGSTTIARQWSGSEPRPLWKIDVGEGYAGAAILQGRVFLMDYDREKKEESLRCLSLGDGREIWRFAYPNALKRDHGFTRTVPAATPECVVGIGSRCHVVCVATESGALRWGLDLVAEAGAKVPPWYTGQCPLIDGHRLVLAPGGPEALLMAVDLATGGPIWRTPNPRGWKMTHSSVVPVEFDGKRMYVYCASGGVAGVSAETGALLWETGDWKIGIATVPLPVDLGNGRLFLTGGYNAGSALLRLVKQGDRIVPEIAYRLKPEVFGATQHSPIFYQDHLYGVRADGRFVCLTPEGRVMWTSDPDTRFGLGPFVIVNGAIVVLDDGGTMSLLEATASGYRPLARKRVLDGPESWGPLALAGGRLVARDLRTMVCLDLAER